MSKEVLSKEAMKTETAVNNTGQAAAALDALLPAVLQSSPGFDPTGDRAFKGE